MSTTVETTPRSTRAATMRLTQIAILAALVIVLQLIGSFTGIKIGPFTPTLALIPIIIGAVLFGPSAGAFLGAVFSVVVCIAVVTGADPGGLLMFQENPVVTLLLCMLKGTAAGFVGGLLYKAVRNTSEIAALALAAIATPVVNTGILCIGMLTVFAPLVTGWAEAAGSASIGKFILISVVGINFLFELVLDAVLVPVIRRIISAVSKKKS